MHHVENNLFDILQQMEGADADVSQAKILEFINTSSLVVSPSTPFDSVYVSSCCDFSMTLFSDNFLLLSSQF